MIRISLALATLAAMLQTATAANWSHWRGPRFDGSSDEKSLPATFSKTENVRWSAPLPGAAAATPIIWEDHVFISSVDDQTKSLRAICLDRRNGKVRWNEEIGPGAGLDARSNFASPSPVTDGKLVYFLYGNGDLAAFDFAGKKVWGRNLQKDYGAFAYQWTYGASPTLFDGRLLLQVLQRNEPVHGRGRTDGPIDSYLLALDPATGKEQWKHTRPSDAKMESREAYSTIIPYRTPARTELLVTGGDAISGHDPADGKELWRWGTWNPTRITHWRLVPSPVTGAGIILACAPKGSPIFAFKAGAKGTLTDQDLAWKSTDREISSDVATPLFYGDRFYVLKGEQRPTISRVEPATGKVEWTGELDSRAIMQCSPTAADGRIYMQNFRGEVFVVAAAPEFKLLAKVPMGDEDDDLVRSSVAISQGSLFIRTARKLYCVAASAGVSAQ